ncbi:DUF3298 and DUF4163 domain-containing protein [Hymenobacter sp. RP-2-7]|uniref:DUF3298 and DUF4163 domain-containing protein n=1 Tax=Hymenobacter polaris TaxID=2682546 RepID=A0A7Y0AHQ1_9BACT|nr:DUF3298 and DUF4163 domain-containing protein [Hymenobacter polaris]NML67510.1 DUF3298 and DUF4163 domain-containing protein [Hymenobacter polaris]
MFSPTRSLRWLVALGGLAACQSPTSQSTATTTQPPAAAPAAPTEATAAVASSPGTAYHAYRGQLPGQADSITLHLVTAPARFFALGSGPGHRGSYYGADGHPYQLQSQLSTAPDSVVLNDVSPERASGPRGEAPVWRLRQQPGGALVGTVAGRPVRLRLLPAPAGTLTLAVRYFADSLAAFPRQAKSPRARLSWQALVPAGGPAAPRQALQASMLRDLRGDTTDARAPLALPALYKQQRDTFFTDYRAELAATPAPTDTSDTGSYRATLNYEQQTASYVLFRGGDLLSVAYFTYDYSGGAHGNYGTTGASYDLRTGRRLRYDDIFLPSAAPSLPALLATAVRPLVGLKPGEALDKTLFVKRMPITHNVYLTAGGVVFTYQPYEIAAYAQGEVAVFLPLGQVRGLLRQGLPLPSAASVAAR